MSSQSDELMQFATWLRHGPNGERPRSGGTIDAYCHTAERFVTFLDGRGPDQEAAKAFADRLHAEGNSSNSIARHVYALRAYFAFKGSPLTLEPPAKEKKRPRWLTDEEWGRLLQVAERGVRDARTLPARHRALFRRAVLMVYRGAGLRLSEGINLRRDDVDPEKGVVWVGERPVRVYSSVIASLQAWMDVHESPWVFPAKRCEPVSRGTMQAAVHRLMREAGLKVQRPMDTLRHTVAIDLGLRGADEWQIQEALRHENVSTTRALYREELKHALRLQFDRPVRATTSVDRRRRDQMKPRNVVTLSDLDLELEKWARDEARRRRKLGLPGGHLYEVVEMGLQLLRHQMSAGRRVFFLRDGRGPYPSVHHCLDALGVPLERRGLYWFRWDRLPEHYRSQIVPKLKRCFVYDGKNLDDPDPRLTPDEVRLSLSDVFPELAQASIKETIRGSETVYVFDRQTGMKGSLPRPVSALDGQRVGEKSPVALALFRLTGSRMSGVAAGG